MNHTRRSSWRRAAPWVVIAALTLAALACAASSPGTLNDGKGKRDEPVPERRYAHTEFYDIRTLNVLWPSTETTQPDEESNERATATAEQITATEGGNTPTPTPESETSAGPAASVPTPTESPMPDTYIVRVRFQVRCTKPKDEVCDLETIAHDVKLVDQDGVLYPPIFSLDSEKPLEGEVLGDGEKTGWLDYEVPVEATIDMVVAEYGQDQRVFFALAKQEEQEQE